ncbi:MAG: sensor histidine kinase [Bacteroidia bacterium]
MNKNLNLLIHVLGCAAFLALPVLFSPDFSLDFTFIHLKSFQRDFLFSIFLLIFFYLNYFYLVPKFYFEKKYVLFFVISFVSFILFLILPALLIHGSAGQQNTVYTSLFIRDLRGRTFQLLIVLFFSLLLRISNQWKKLEKEKLDAELSYLKAQINPHFLFNTLNSIYSLAIVQSDNVASSIVKLSNMMRYILSESSSNSVNMEKEIDYIRSYIELQQIRFGTFIDFNCDITGDPKGKKIAPLVLIPFIENAYKHGVNAEEDSIIRIEIDITDEIVRMYVMNNKVHVHRSEELKSGLGVDNTRNRLQMLYPGRHHLDIINNNKEYSVTLTIQLT